MVVMMFVFVSVGTVRTGVSVASVAGWSTFGKDGTLTGVAGRAIRAVTVVEDHIEVQL